MEGVGLNVIEGWARDRGRLREDDKASAKLGFKVERYCTGHGDLLIKKHKLLEGDTYSGYGIIVDPDHIQKMVVPGRDFKHNKDIQTNGTDATEEEYLTEAGLNMELEETMAIVTGVTQ